MLTLHRQQLGLDVGTAREIEEVALGSRRSRASGVRILRDAVYDARRRGRVGAERGLLNELRVVANLSEADLEQLIEEPLGVQRRKVLGWRYWPRRAAHYCVMALAIGVGTVSVMKVAEVIEGCNAGQSQSPTPSNPTTTDASVDPTNEDPPKPAPSAPPPNSEHEGPTTPEITSTSYVLRLA